MDTFSKFSQFMPLERLVRDQTIVEISPPPVSKATTTSLPDTPTHRVSGSSPPVHNATTTSSPDVSTHRVSGSSSTTCRRADSPLQSSLTTSTTRTSSPELEIQPILKCFTLRGRHAGRNVPRAPPLKRIEKEVRDYFNGLHTAQSISDSHGFKFCFRNLDAEQEAHLLACIWRREWDAEDNILSRNMNSGHRYPNFWPKWKMVDDMEWKFIDHEGDVRPEAYVAYSKATGEPTPSTQKELDMWKMEELAYAKCKMGDVWWGEIHDWVIGIKDENDTR